MSLQPAERIYYRDKLRTARYAALAKAEAFQQICFAIEEFGTRLLGKVATMKAFEKPLADLLAHAGVLCDAREQNQFSAIYNVVRSARNDAMHTGTYARHVTAKAVEVCMLLEDALMNGAIPPIQRVGDHMVKEPVWVEPWQTVSRARQLMLTHSFSNLPIRLDGKWLLLTEHGLARCLTLAGRESRQLLAQTISDVRDQLGLVEAHIISEDFPMASLLGESEWRLPGAPLWLVVDDDRNLVGVISVSELL